MTALAAVSGGAVALIALLALRTPMVARMAVRNVTRRRGETVLVVLGAMLGTAIITGSLLVGDTLDASIRAGAPNQLGPTDLIVRPGSPEDAAAAAAALEGTEHPGVDGVLDLTTTIAAVEGGGLAEPRARLLEVDFARAARFGGEPVATGISGPTPGPGETVLGADLAGRLGVQRGDTVLAHLGSEAQALMVTGILPRTGIAGFSDDGGSTSPNAFVAPGTLAAATGAVASRAAPFERLLLVSATGDVFSGADRTDAATAAVRAALGDVPAEVAPVKRDLLDDARLVGDEFSTLFLTIGAFAVLAGVLLLVNIFVMLAEERKSELGMLRAVGFTRRRLVTELMVEGGVYAVAAAALGAVAGVGVGRAIVAVTSGIFAGDGGLTVVFAPDPASIVTGFCIGLLLALGTIAASSARIGRLNIIAAIRDLPEPTGGRSRRWSAALAALGAVGFGVLSARAFAAEDPVGVLAFPALAVLGVAVVLARSLPRRPLVSAVAGGLIVWGLTYDRLVDASEAEIIIFVVQGVLLTFSAIVLLSQNQELVGAAVRRLGGGQSLVARLGLAYPLARRFRTGMTLAMYSLVVFTLVVVATLTGVLSSQLEDAVADESGAFDLAASTNSANPIDPAALAAVADISAVAPLTGAVAQFKAGDDPAMEWGLTGVDAAFVEAGALALTDWDRVAYATADDVWRAVLADPGVMVSDAFFLDANDEGVSPSVGATVAAIDPVSGRTAPRTIIGQTAAGRTGIGALASAASVAELVGPAAVDRYYVAVADGADAEAVAAEVQRRFVVNGVVARTFRSTVEELASADRQFFRLLQGYLSLGLVIGVAGLGVVMIRAVRDRRRQVGMLRSIGVPAATVRSAFLLESGFVALEGLVIGGALGLLTAYQVFAGDDAFGDAAFDIPWTQLALLLVVTLLASLAATAAPAVRAARVRPAVALRIAD